MINRIYKIVGKFFTIILCLILLVIIFYPLNGGPTINLRGGLYIHADPPRKKLLRYMNDKLKCSPFVRQCGINSVKWN